MFKTLYLLILLEIILYTTCKDDIITGFNYTEVDLSIEINRNLASRISGIGIRSTRTPKKLYTTRYEDNNVTGTGNIMIDVIYRAKCDLLKCNYCCSSSLNLMICESESRCKLFYAWKRFLNIGVPLLIVFGAFFISYLIFLITACRNPKFNRSEACAKSCLYLCQIIYVIFCLPCFIFGVKMEDLFCCCKSSKNPQISEKVIESFPHVQNSNPYTNNYNQIEPNNIRNNEYEIVRPPNSNFDSERKFHPEVEKEKTNDPNLNNNFENVLQINHDKIYN